MLMTLFIINLALFGGSLWRQFQLHQSWKLIQQIATELEKQVADAGHAFDYDVGALSEEEFAAMVEMSNKILDDACDEQYEAENKEDQ